MIRSPLHRRWLAVLGAAAIGAVAAGAAWFLDRPAAPAANAPGPAVGLARVVRTDLVTTQPVPGTIGYGPVITVVAPGGSSAAALAQAQGAVSAASQKLAADRQAAVDQAAVDQQAVAQAQAALDAARLQARQRQDQSEAAVAADQVALDTATRALQPVQTDAVRGTVYTGFPAVGATVAQGQALYDVDGRPVPLLYGSLPLHRALTPGCSGPDVKELEQDLLQLGYASPAGLTADGTFTAADAAAVRRWQAALGAAQTGDVAMGDAVFLPGAVRVAAVHAGAGGPVQAGQPILDVTSATRVVTVNLNPSLVYAIKQGDAVTVDLPDGRTRTPGVVSAVSGVAQQLPQGQAGQTQNGAPQSVVPVTITLSDPGQVPPLDQAPVTVDVTTQSAKNVLAVPVNALLALEGGGYAVEVPGPGRSTHLVAVKTGIFDNSQVEVSGAGLAEGMSVVVPQ